MPSALRFGESGPTTVEMLPPGKFREQMERLRPEMRQRALAKLDELHVPVNDVNSLRVGSEGDLMYACVFPVLRQPSPDGPKAKRLENPVPVPPAAVTVQGAAVPNTSPPIRHSRPGASRVLYLDFNGAVISGLYWNERYPTSDSTYLAKPYDFDGFPGTLNDAEQASIVAIWERVAEDYSPFDIDVTTELPAVFTSTTAHALITFSTDGSAEPKYMPEGDSAGGVAWLDVFGRSSLTFKSPALVYVDNVGGATSTANIAEVISHEVGHNLSLNHDGTATKDYYAGHGSGETSWAPIMGAAYGRSMTQWSRGEYAGANNTEDDLALIAARLSYRPDDVGGTRANATPLTVVSTAVSASGVISSYGDEDYFSFFTEASPVTLTATPYRAALPPNGANLDVRMELLDANGASVAVSDPPSITSATLSTTLPRGTYYLRISAVGAGSPATTGYSDYGSRGQYTISGTILPSSGPPPVITSGLSVTAIRNSFFSYQITATNQPTAYNATGLPPGVTVNQATGAISGFPSSTGNYIVNLVAANPFGTATASLAFNVYATPLITSATTVSATVNQPFSYQIVASNNATAYNATGLPPGVTVNQATGAISGTPTSAGTFNVQLAAANPAGTGTATLVLTVRAAPVVSSPLSALATPGASFSYQITATNSPTAFNASGLPSGLTVNQTTGVISGTTTAVGTYLVQLTVANTVGTNTAILTLSVYSRPTITSSTSVQAVKDLPYQYQITATGTPTAYNATGLPPGMTVDQTTGLVRGTPTSTGVFVVTLAAANPAGSHTVSLTLSVIQPPTITSPLTASNVRGQAFSYQTTATFSPLGYTITGLPNGLSYSNVTGLITGVVTAPAGVYPLLVTAGNAAGSTTVTVTLSVYATPAISSSLTASGGLNVPFSYQITAANVPTSFNATGLPPGVTVNQTTGLISGTPTSSGVFAIGLAAANPAGTHTATLTLTVYQAPVLTSSLTGTAGRNIAFSYQIAGTNTPTAFNATGLPPGVTVNQTTGAISGTPTAAGVYNVVLAVANPAGTNTGTLVLTVLAPPVVTSATTAVGGRNIPFSYQIAGSNSPTTFAATGLPAGLAVNSTTGIISGTPTAAGTSTITLTVTNVAGSGTASLALTVYAAPAITSSLTASAGRGLAFSYQIAGSNSPTAYNATGLPPGVTVNQSTGLISGTPTSAGTFAVGLAAANPGGTSTATLTLTVYVPPVISSALAVSAVRNQAFTYQIAAANTPTSFAASGLPTGLAVNATTGVISGTPTAAAGNYTVQITATNPGGSHTQALVITIYIPPVISSPLTAGAARDNPFSYQLAAANSPTAFNATGLPPGLAVNQTTGLVSGTPTAAGVYHVTLAAANPAGTQTSTLVLTVYIPPVISSPLTATAGRNTAFSYQITATNSATAYNAVGLPPGVTVNQTTGLISGTPTSAGVFAVNLAVANPAGSHTATLTLTVYVTPAITSVLAASAVKDQPSSYQITASNTPTAFNAAGLPPGMTVNQTTGLISGTPTSSGVFVVNLAAANPAGTHTANLTLTVYAPPAITSSLTAGVARDAAFSYQIAASNLPTTYNAVGLPPGVTVNQTTGLVSGTPTSAGVYGVNIAAANPAGSDVKTLTLTVYVTPVITSALTATANRNASFSYQIAANNLPTSFGATGLPAGLAINATTGLISGSPTAAAGNYTVTLTATNPAGSHSASLVLTLVTPIAITTPPADQVVAQNGTATFSVVATSADPLSYQWRFRGQDLAGATAATLTLTNVQAVDVGPYDVRVTNGSQTLTSRSALLALRNAPAAQSDFNGDGFGDLVVENEMTGERVIWFMRGSGVLSTSDLPTFTAGWHFAGAGDFNADGKADIVLQNTQSGERVIWLMNGATIAGSAGLPTLPLAWQIACIGDLNGDGKPDVVLQNTQTNDRIIWLMNGTTISGSVALPSLPAAWQICGLVDFDGDGQSDVLLQNTRNGERVIWVLNAQFGIARSVNLPSLPATWRFAGVGRLTLDNLPNIILQHSQTGDRLIWSINPDGTIAHSTALPTLPIAWNLGGPATNRATAVPLHDFSGDGGSDILVTNGATGDRIIWEITGGAISRSIGLPVLDPVQRLAGVGDFNGDGLNDVITQHGETGEMRIWPLNGAVVEDSVALPVLPAGWLCAGVVDVSGDGQPDILLQSLTTGERMIWVMEFTRVHAALALPRLPANWLIAGGGFFSADGRAGVLLENTTSGDRLFWTLNPDGSIYQSVGLPTFLGGWRFAGTGDFNADGHVDILLQNLQTGDRVIWLMNRTAIAGSVGLPALPPAWTLRD